MRLSRDFLSYFTPAVRECAHCMRASYLQNRTEDKNVRVREEGLTFSSFDASTWTKPTGQTVAFHS